MARAVLWKRLTEELSAEIARRRFRPGERFYSLKELSDRYGVSEITGRRVMDELQGRALIERIQGKGSFVRRAPVARDLKVLMDPALMLGSFSHAHLVQEILQGAGEQAHAARCRLQFVSPTYLGHHARAEDLFLTIWHSKHAASCTAIRERGLRGVVTHAPLTVPGLSTVRPDFRAGMRLATAYLIAKGHRRIAFLAGEVGGVWYQARFDGYYQALKDAGLPLDLKLVKETTDEGVGVPEAGRRDEVAEALAQLRELADPPTAVACGNDGRALQLLRVCQARGVRVPGKLAVVGFDNHHESQWSSPALTTVDQFWRGQGRAAVEVLLRRADDAATVVEDVIIPPALVERDST